MPREAFSKFPVPRSHGRATLLVRATDAKGRTQPTHRDADRGGYQINEVPMCAASTG